jgi:hypothetical protein
MTNQTEAQELEAGRTILAGTSYEDAISIAIQKNGLSDDRAIGSGCPSEKPVVS